MSELLALHKSAIKSKDWGGDIMKLKYWDFLEAKPYAVRDDGSPRAGIWRITPAGRAFARGNIDALKYQYVYNSELVGRAAPDLTRVWIDDCLKEPFDFGALAKATPDGSREPRRPI
jgi:hypothetical protein